MGGSTEPPEPPLATGLVHKILTKIQKNRKNVLFKPVAL